MRVNKHYHYPVLLLLVMLASQVVLAGGNDFNNLVKQIESHYKVRKTHVPFLGLAGFAVKVIRPAGVKEFKLAIFENQDFTTKPGQSSFNSVMQATLSPSNWGPIIRSQSQRGAEQTYIYSRPAGKDFQLLIVNLNDRQAAVIQTKVNVSTLVKWMAKADGSDFLSAFNIGSGPSRSNARYTAKYDPANGEDDKPTLAHAKSISPDTTTAQPEEKTLSTPVLKTASTSGDEVAAEPGGKGEVHAPAVAEPIDKDAIRLESRLVNLNVKATDRSGKIIQGLTKDDFEVYEENTQQRVTHFQPITAPVNLVLLLDLSGSTHKKTKVIKQSAKKFVDSLNPTDTITVATFTRRFRIISLPSSDHNLIKHRIDQINNSGAGTNYYDAMWSALDVLKQGKGMRNAIVVMTDGVDNAISHPMRGGSQHNIKDLLARIAEDDATIYPIYLDTEAETVGRGPSDTHEDYAKAREQLAAVAEESGGLLFKASRAEDLNGVYPRVASELHTLYSLAYSPNRPDSQESFHKVSIKLNRNGAIARTRKGYFGK